MKIALQVLAALLLVAAGAQAQIQTQVPHAVAKAPLGQPVRVASPAGPVHGGGTVVGTCGTIAGGGERPMRDYRRAGDLHHAVVAGLMELQAIDAEIVRALDAAALGGPCPAPRMPYHTFAGLLAQRMRVARQIAEQPLEPIYAAFLPPAGWTFELHVALQRLEARMRAGQMGRIEYQILRKHLIETLSAQQEAFAMAAGIVVQPGGAHRRMQPRIIGIVP